MVEKSRSLSVLFFLYSLPFPLFLFLFGNVSRIAPSTPNGELPHYRAKVRVSTSMEKWGGVRLLSYWPVTEWISISKKKRTKTSHSAWSACEEKKMFHKFLSHINFGLIAQSSQNIPLQSKPIWSVQQLFQFILIILTSVFSVDGTVLIWGSSNLIDWEWKLTDRPAKVLVDLILASLEECRVQIHNCYVVVERIERDANFQLVIASS